MVFLGIRHPVVLSIAIESVTAKLQLNTPRQGPGGQLAIGNCPTPLPRYSDVPGC